jgi:hypothetical protein
MTEHIHGGLLKWIEQHPGTGSWVQAVGSILALIVAFWIANAQSREASREAKAAKREHFDAVIGLADEAFYLIKSAANVLTEGPLETYFIREYSSATFDDVSSALMQAAMHPLGSSKAVKSLQNLRRLLLHTHQILRRAREAHHLVEALAVDANGIAKDAEEELQTIKNVRAGVRSL